ITLFHFRLCLCATEGIFRCSLNYDQLAASLRQVGVIVAAAGLLNGALAVDQAPLSALITLGGLALIGTACLEK
ncbi:MAG: hypothetical protein OXE97_05940, partial [Gammaproteobacteria bacterium]|nr:hypothetical protein [Gammaproteobacteria bacterium]